MQTTFAFKGVGKTGPAHSFPTLTSVSINLVQKLGYLGGEKLWLVCYFPTLTSESINLTLSWICKQPLLFRGWGKTGPAHSFPTPTRYRHQPCAEARLSGWRKTGPAHSFPYPTSESINLTLSWICKQPLLFRGWGKTGPAHSFPTPTR